VFLAENDFGDRLDYAGVVCRASYSLLHTAVPSQSIVCELTEPDRLADGDIVRIDQDGVVSVLHEVGDSEATVFLTNRCNACCGFCPQPQQAGDCFRPGEAHAFIGLLGKPTEVVGITGGEPTVARGALIEVIGACRRYLPQARVDLLTNAILLADDDYVAELAAIGGRSVVYEIPIYSDVSLEHNWFMGTRGFEPTIRGIFHLARYQQQVALRTVIHRQNYTRLPQLAEFIARNFPFACHVALMGLEVVHRGRTNAATYWIDPMEYTTQLEEAARILKRADMAVSIYNLPLCVLPTSLWGLTRKSISSWKRGYLPTCGMCCVQDLCGGVFLTSGVYQSQYLRPVGDRCDFTWAQSHPPVNVMYAEGWADPSFVR
jgi:His-Xaa-Ser system radical SAM maturase HxsC